MTVWIMSPFDNLPQEGFRKQRYWRMAEAFAVAGNEVVYWTGNFNHGTKAKRIASVKVDSPVQLEILAVMPYSKNISIKRLLSHRQYARTLNRVGMAKLETRPPKIIISAVPTLSAAKVAQQLAIKSGAKFVLDIQDAWPETFYRILPRPLRWLGKLLFFPMHLTARKLYRTADIVTGVSEKYASLCGRTDYYLAYHGI